MKVRAVMVISVVNKVSGLYLKKYKSHGTGNEVLR